MLRRDGRRTVTAIAGVAFSYFLMVFQGGLFTGFLSAASKVIRASGASVWVTSADTPCFEFAAPMRDALGLELQGITGVEQTARVVVASAHWLGPKGQRRAVTLIGSEPLEGSELPSPRMRHGHYDSEPEWLIVDDSAVGNLGLEKPRSEVELNGRRAVVVGMSTGFGTFLGAPYAFADYETARFMLGVQPLQTMLIAVRLEPRADRSRVLATIHARYPELQVLDADEFARRSGSFWMTQTGAGGAIALAGILGFLIGGLIISQVLYAMTIDRLDEFATLQAIGASTRLPSQIVGIQAIICALCGAGVGALVLGPLVVLAKRFVVSWLDVPWWLPVACLGLSLVVAVQAARASLRLINGVDPVRVFRN